MQIQQKKKCKNKKLKKTKEYVGPEFRWTSYAELKAAQLALVRGGDFVTALGYTETTWNKLGTNLVNDRAFYGIGGLKVDQQEAAKQLGYDGGTCDCDQSHYSGYSWSRMKDYNMDTYWMALGYNQANWDRDEDPPDTEEMDWDELTQAQQNAATKLCYFKGSWDWIPIPEWN